MHHTGRIPETVLIRQKAQRLSNGELAAEIQRCRYGMQVAANRSACSRFERRLILMEEEADSRMELAQGGRRSA